MAVRIVTDSTADLPKKLVAEHGIAVVPLNIHFGEEVLKDGVDIWSEEFYHRLKNSPILPNTSQPAPGEFLKTYQQIARSGDTIISIHISEELSGTLGSATVAASMLSPDIKVITFDSRTVSMALGLLVIQAAKMAKAGATTAEIINRLQEYQQELVVYFTVNSLEHLQRTGRIGKASAFLGCLLSIKPLLAITDGGIIPIEKIRGNFQKVAQQMVANIAGRFGKRRLLVSIVHTQLPELLQILRVMALEQLTVSELTVNLMGPVVGSHAGPDTIGIIAMLEE